MSEEKKSSLEGKIFPVPEGVQKRAFVGSKEEYKKMWQRSVDDPGGFWGDIAEGFWWHKKWDTVYACDFNTVDIKWFVGAQTNITVNCLDRHLDTIGDKPAIIWEGNEPGESKIYTYQELYTEVCKCANVLKSKGITKGDRVAIYMPMVPELAIAMMACARIGAIHSIVFGGFSAEALRDRILDSTCKALITTNNVMRGKKLITLKEAADAALQMCADEGHSVDFCLVHQRHDAETNIVEGRDIWWHEAMADAEPTCEPEMMDAEDPLFILYTSGSTGKPKGVMHTVGGYMVYTATSFKYVFDYHPGDVFWCTADIGWVTGHSYIVYGPLANGAQSLMFEGVPTYPDPGRFWAVCEKYKVNIFYTAPTAIRAIAREGDEWVKKYDLSSLRLLGTVGEPINPEAWLWYYYTVGGGNCPIVDTYWQTETGGIIITPLPGATAIKPGSATVPFLGVKPSIINEEGQPVAQGDKGYLVIEQAWPGLMRTVYGDHQRFKETYFTQFPGRYTTGDGAFQDADGYFWIIGRLDDVINVSGHRMGTAEVESALVSHPQVAEAAVVGFPHDIKGQGIYAYVTLNANAEKSDELKKELVKHVRKEIGPIATPDRIQWADALPKTRSGKIMRRILKKIAANDLDSLGDTSTLADPSVVETLIAGR
ncbi:MAG: acetate--CoA ligase [Candidatus Lernaella stagnicola]|nr:acetate--CoA ligase [Candidatus Lernaella stagnicola]